MRRPFTLLTAATALLISAPLATPAFAHGGDAAVIEKASLRAAAGWLARQLTDGNHMRNGQYDDHGLTIDAVLAFQAAQVAGDPATKATDWLARPENTAGYLGDGKQESYAGPHAKLALLALSQGRDPEDFGGRKILTELAGLQQESGRYSDTSQYGNFSNVFSQSLAVLALQRTPGKAPAEAVEFLASSQCDDGGFPQNFGEQPCTGNVDGTGLAAQAMLATGRDERGAKALDWLVGHQKGNGGFNNGAATVDTTNPVNANSTGNALQALNAGKHSATGKAATWGDAAKKAADFLRSLQVSCSGAPDQRGAITYDGTYNAGKDPRATAGALLGLSGVSMMDISIEGVEPAAPSADCTESAEPTPSSPQVPTQSSSGTSTQSAGTGQQTTTVSAVRHTVVPTGKLPVTGVAVGTLAGIGSGLLLAGGLLMTVTRRRTR